MTKYNVGHRTPLRTCQDVNVYTLDRELADTYMGSIIGLVNRIKGAAFTGRPGLEAKPRSVENGLWHRFSLLGFDPNEAPPGPVSVLLGFLRPKGCATTDKHNALVNFDSYYVANMATLEGFESKGIGREILRTFFGVCTQHKKEHDGPEHMTVEHMVSEERTGNIYQRFGFPEALGVFEHWQNQLPNRVLRGNVEEAVAKYSVQMYSEKKIY